MKKLLLLLSCLVGLTACQDIGIVFPDNPQDAVAPNSFTIPLTEALTNLSAFNENEDEVSRSENNREIDTILVVCYNDVLSRSVDKADTILYVVNYKNNSGYAILAADKRISDPLIASVDEGSMDEQSIRGALVAQPIRPTFEGYPTTGDGFFTTPETGDEIFINPNTVNLYIAGEDEDPLIGNYQDDTPSTSGTHDIFDEYRLNFENAFVAELCVNYAVFKIESHNDQTIRSSVDVDVPSDGFIGGGTGGTARPEITTTETEYSQWTRVKTIYPLMSEFKYWDQRTPFNDQYPYRRKAFIMGHRRKARAGCVPLSIAKVMTKFSHPYNYTYNGVTVDWQALKANPLPSEFTLEQQNSASTLLLSISDKCDSWYFYQGTFTLPVKAENFMSFNGFLNVHRRNYNFDRVVSMIGANKPLIIYSIPGINIFNAHCWILDGYKIKSRIKTTKTYLNNQVIKTEQETEFQNMVHCDFGWGGQANGYFVSGVFDLKNSENELDPGADTDKSDNYNHHLRVIMYDLP